MAVNRETQQAIEVAQGGNPNLRLTQLAAVEVPTSSLLLAVPTCAFALSDALTALSLRLQDATNQFWSVAELIIYFQEALRTWNALTSYFRGDFTFSAVQGATFYDLTNSVVMPNSLRLRTLKAADLFNVVEYHLLEPVVGTGTWAGSAQFSIADITQAVVRRRDEVIGVTGCYMTRILIQAVPGRTSLPGNITDVRRIAFLPVSGSPVVLWQSDIWSLQAFSSQYRSGSLLGDGNPTSFALSTEPWLTFDVDSAPQTPGQYELLVVTTPPSPLSQSLPDADLLVPDDWAWVIKWGVLADLMAKEAVAKDSLRAQYAEMRYKQGLSLLTYAPALLAMRNNNVPIQIDAIRAYDLYQTGWQGLAQGPPATCLTANMNLIALSPPADGNRYTMTVTVVENAPVVVNTTDCVITTRDVFDAVLDYAHHIAMFKVGGAEFMATMLLLDRFMQLATLYSSKLQEQGEFQRVLYELSQRERALNPIYSTDRNPAAAEGGQT